MTEPRPDDRRDSFLPRLLLLALVAIVSVGLLATYVFSSPSATPPPAVAGRPTPAAARPAAPAAPRATPRTSSAAPGPTAVLPTAVPPPPATDPDGARAAANLGNQASQSQDYATAIREFTRAIELHAAPIYHSLRGDIYWRQKDYQAALADYDKAIAYDPANPDGYFGRARVYRDMGDRGGALRDLQRFLELKPNDAPNAGIRQEAQAMIDELR